MSDTEKGPSFIRLAMAEMEKFTPKEGFNLVGVDTYEQPGEALYLVGHFDTKEEAEQAKQEMLKEDPEEVLHIYGPRKG